MDNDKAFAAYALTVFAGVATMLTIVLTTHLTTPPSPLSVLEHVTAGLLIRAAYKSLGGWSWADWSVTSEAIAERAVPLHAELTA